MTIREKGKPIDLTAASLAIAQSLEEKELAYNSANLADCSGIFHRVLQEFKAIYPKHKYPSVKKYRDSRSLALWYKKQGKLTEVQAGKEEELGWNIRPGMAMFYGKNAISHVGLVVAVIRDEKGQVLQYSLFHGRNPRHFASITDFHRLEPSRAEYPVYGDGGMRWLAFAPVVF